MTPAPLWTAVALLCGCGGVSGVPVSLEIYAPGATALSDVDAYQVAVLKGASVDCQTVEATCLKSWSGYSSSALVSISGSDGKLKKALLIPNTLGGAGGNQAIVVDGIPPGDNYAVVIEAVSKAHQFLGSYCGIQQHITAGSNSAGFVAQLTLLATPLGCDPRIP